MLTLRPSLWRLPGLREALGGELGSREWGGGQLQGGNLQPSMAEGVGLWSSFQGTGIGLLAAGTSWSKTSCVESVSQVKLQKLQPHLGIK